MPALQTSTIDCRCPADEGLRRVRDLACWWSEVGASRDCPSLELRQRLLQLRPSLTRHLASLGSQTPVLLLADLDQLIARLGNCAPSQACWIDLSHAIGLFLSQLEKLDIGSRSN
jgi:hypothetical protein